jgi:hypothetical protein
MGVLSRLFGRSKKQYEEMKAKVAAMPGYEGFLAALKEFEDAMAMARNPEQCPFFRLGRAILESSVRCTKELDSRIKFPTKKKRRYQAWLVQFAFAIFYLHLALRKAFAKFGPAGRDKVLKRLGPLLIGTMARSWAAPEDGLAEIRSDLYNIAQGWEIEYSRFPDLISGMECGKELTGNSLFAALTRNVLELSGYQVPEIEEHTQGLGYADFEGAGGKWRCRYSTDAEPVVNPFTPFLVQHLVIGELKALSLPDHIEKIMSAK